MKQAKLFCISLFVLIFLSTNLIKAVNKESSEPAEPAPVKSKLELLSAVKKAEPLFGFIDLNSRRTKSIIYSTFVPGSGQTYLGNELKGIGFTVGFFGTALTAILAHNNMVGREDRIQALTQTYLATGDFKTAEQIWNQIKFEEGNRDNDHKRRQIFSYTALGVWILNMVDVIFFSEDFGADEFSSVDPGFNLNLSSAADLTGIELKFNLP